MSEIVIPESFETERLLIRKPLVEDAAALNAAVVSSLDRLKLWMPWAQTAPTAEETAEYNQHAIEQWNKRENLTMRFLLKETNTIIGSGGFPRLNWDVPLFEIGYWIRTGYEGQGYVTEAVHGMTAFAFDVLQANRVEIRMDNLNERSWRVAERCGFALEGVLRNECVDVSGRLRDTRIYAKITQAKRHE